jgi:hypothetical protein
VLAQEIFGGENLAGTGVERQPRSGKRRRSGERDSDHRHEAARLRPEPALHPWRSAQRAHAARAQSDLEGLGGVESEERRAALRDGREGDGELPRDRETPVAAEVELRCAVEDREPVLAWPYREVLDPGHLDRWTAREKGTTRHERTKAAGRNDGARA